MILDNHDDHENDDDEMITHKLVFYQSDASASHSTVDSRSCKQTINHHSNQSVPITIKSEVSDDPTRDDLIESVPTSPFILQRRC